MSFQRPPQYGWPGAPGYGVPPQQGAPYGYGPQGGMVPPGGGYNQMGYNQGGFNQGGYNQGGFGGPGGPVGVGYGGAVPPQGPSAIVPPGGGVGPYNQVGGYNQGFPQQNQHQMNMAHRTQGAVPVQSPYPPQNIPPQNIPPQNMPPGQNVSPIVIAEQQRKLREQQEAIAKQQKQSMAQQSLFYSEIKPKHNPLDTMIKKIDISPAPSRTPQQSQYQQQQQNRYQQQQQSQFQQQPSFSNQASNDDFGDFSTVPTPITQQTPPKPKVNIDEALSKTISSVSFNDSSKGSKFQFEKEERRKPMVSSYKPSFETSKQSVNWMSLGDDIFSELRTTDDAPPPSLRPPSPQPLPAQSFSQPTPVFPPAQTQTFPPVQTQAAFPAQTQNSFPTSFPAPTQSFAPSDFGGFSGADNQDNFDEFGSFEAAGVGNAFATPVPTSSFFPPVQPTQPTQPTQPVQPVQPKQVQSTQPSPLSRDRSSKSFDVSFSAIPALPDFGKPDIKQEDDFESYLNQAMSKNKNIFEVAQPVQPVQIAQPTQPKDENFGEPQGFSQLQTTPSTFQTTPASTQATPTPSGNTSDKYSVFYSLREDTPPASQSEPQPAAPQKSHSENDFGAFSAGNDDFTEYNQANFAHPSGAQWGFSQETSFSTQTQAQQDQIQPQVQTQPQNQSWGFSQSNNFNTTFEKPSTQDTNSFTNFGQDSFGDFGSANDADEFSDFVSVTAEPPKPQETNSIDVFRKSFAESGKYNIQVSADDIFSSLTNQDSKSQAVNTSFDANKKKMLTAEDLLTKFMEMHLYKEALQCKLHLDADSNLQTHSLQHIEAKKSGNQAESARLEAIILKIKKQVLSRDILRNFEDIVTGKVAPTSVTLEAMFEDIRNKKGEEKAQYFNSKYVQSNIDELAKYTLETAVEEYTKLEFLYKKLCSDDYKQIAHNSQRCLEKVSHEIHLGINFIESVDKDDSTSESEKKEIFSSVQFKNYLSDLTEAIRIYFRLMITYNNYWKLFVSHEENDQFVRASNQAQEDFYTLSQLLQTHKLAGFSIENEFIDPKSFENPSLPICQVCSVPFSGNEDQTKLSSTRINWGGKSFHCTCANFWVNRVDENLPVIH